MAWYFILFYIMFAFFIIKSIISWVFGDLDVDFDLDGDVDFDISSLFSFKGIIHFLLGFSSYLCLIAKVNNFGSHEIYHFTVINYISAVLVGILLMVLLYFAYKFAMKLNHDTTEEINLDGYNATILTYNGEIQELEYSYTVLVNTPNGSKKIDVISHNRKLKNGSIHPIHINEQGIYYID